MNDLIGYIADYGFKAQIDGETENIFMGKKIDKIELTIDGYSLTSISYPASYVKAHKVLTFNEYSIRYVCTNAYEDKTTLFLTGDFVFIITYTNTDSNISEVEVTKCKEITVVLEDSDCIE